MLRGSFLRGSMLILEFPKLTQLTPFDRVLLQKVTNETGELVAKTVRTKPSFSLSKSTLMSVDLHRPFGQEAQKIASDREFWFRAKIHEPELEKLGKVRKYSQESRRAIFPAQAERLYLQYIHEIIKQSCGNCIEIAILTHMILYFKFVDEIESAKQASAALKALRPVISGLNPPHDHAFNLITSPPIGGRYTIDNILLVIDNWHARRLQLSPEEYQEHLSKSVDLKYINLGKRVFDLKLSVNEKYNNPKIILEAIKILQKEGILPDFKNKELY